MYLGCQRVSPWSFYPWTVVLIYPPTVESSMRIQQHRRISADETDSRQSSLNILPPTARKPTIISVKSLSVRLRSIQEEQSSDRGRQWEPILSSPVRRCLSPCPAWECDGFQCDNHSGDVPHVVGHTHLVVRNRDSIYIMTTSCRLLWEHAKITRLLGKTNRDTR